MSISECFDSYNTGKAATADLDGAAGSVPRLLRQGQTEVQKFVKGVALSTAVRALQAGLQLPRKDVLDEAVAAAVGVVPGFISLLCHTALPLQLLVRRLPLYSVSLSLH